MMPQSRGSIGKSHRGFTLIELLVVISIIAVLSGLLLAGLAQVRRVRATTMTARLMQEIGSATIQHLTEFGTLPPGYATTPALALGDAHDGRPPLLDLPASKRTPDAKILDGFRRPLLVEVTTATTLGKSYVQRIRWASEGRNPSGLVGDSARMDDPTANQDDILFVYEAQSGGQGGFIRQH